MIVNHLNFKNIFFVWNYCERGQTDVLKAECVFASKDWLIRIDQVDGVNVLILYSSISAISNNFDSNSHKWRFLDVDSFIFAIKKILKTESFLNFH